MLNLYGGSVFLLYLYGESVFMQYFYGGSVFLLNLYGGSVFLLNLYSGLVFLLNLYGGSVFLLNLYGGPVFMLNLYGGCLQNGCVTRLVCWWAFGYLSPCAFSLHRWLASCLQHCERESRVSVFPCQYIAYPQQVLCSAFSWLQVSMGATVPQNRTARAKFAWPNGRAGERGQKSQQLRKRMRSSLAIG